MFPTVCEANQRWCWNSSFQDLKKSWFGKDITSKQIANFKYCLLYEYYEYLSGCHLILDFSFIFSQVSNASCGFWLFVDKWGWFSLI